MEVLATYEFMAEIFFPGPAEMTGVAYPNADSLEVAACKNGRRYKIPQNQDYLLGPQFVESILKYHGLKWE